MGVPPFPRPPEDRPVRRMDKNNEAQWASLCREWTLTHGRDSYVYCRLKDGHTGLHMGCTVPGERYSWVDSVTRQIIGGTS